MKGQERREQGIGSTGALVQHCREQGVGKRTCAQRKGRTSSSTKPDITSMSASFRMMALSWNLQVMGVGSKGQGGLEAEGQSEGEVTWA